MTIICRIRNVLMPAVIPFVLCAIASSPVHAADRRPNVLLIMTDDQGWADVRSHGNDRIDTPVMDRIAADGARFDRAGPRIPSRSHPRIPSHAEPDGQPGVPNMKSLKLPTLTTRMACTLYALPAPVAATTHVADGEATRLKMRRQ